MKRNSLILIFCINTLGSILGMELSDAEYIFGETTICLKQSSIWQADTTVDYIVVGYNEQKKINTTIQIPSDICTIQSIKNNIIYRVKEGISNSRSTFYKQDMKTPLIGIVEPCLDNSCSDHKKEHYTYCTPTGILSGEDAIKAAQEDLGRCYKLVLYHAKNYAIKKVITIALPVLSGDFMPSTDAAKVAVDTVVDFVSQKTKIYSMIQLYVKNLLEFQCYQHYLFEHWKKRGVFG